MTTRTQVPAFVPFFPDWDRLTKEEKKEWLDSIKLPFSTATIPKRIADKLRRDDSIRRTLRYLEDYD